MNHSVSTEKLIGMAFSIDGCNSVFWDGWMDYKGTHFQKCLTLLSLNLVLISILMKGFI